MKVLLTGAAGQVGRALQASKPADVELRALSRQELDISDEAAVNRVVGDFAPQVLINAAAYTAVDKAESEEPTARKINVDGPHFLTCAVRDISGARIIHVSTDYVFGGQGTSPHQPGDPTGPLSAYGRSKLLGEVEVLGLLPGRAIVLRTAWIYAAEGKNFLLTMLRLMKERGEVKVVADQRGAPTCANSVARAIWRAVESPDIHGILHWTDEGIASWYEFACAIAEDALAAGQLTRETRVIPIRTVDYPTPAVRPLNSVLDLTTTVQRLGLNPVPWRENLRTTLRTLSPH
jgi:dTDP-4-dehydrorhamnose reductase